MAALRLLQPAVWRVIQQLPRLLRSARSVPNPYASRGLAGSAAGLGPARRPHGSVTFATRSSDGPDELKGDLRTRPDAVAHTKGLRLRLDVEASALIDAHREALRAVLAAIQAVPEASDRDVRLVQAEIARLGDGFFMLVVAGEYNAGKSSLINALLGRSVLPEGPTPTTAEVTKLKYADVPTPPTLDEHGVMVLGEPVGVLASRLQIVDTPGTNAIDRNHEALTKNFLPLCDIVLFVTSADRPFSESERLFLESIRTWGKKVILAVNKIDLLEGDDAKRQVMQFVSSSAKTLLGSEPKVFALSARLAKQAKESSSGTNGTHWESSGFAPLEEYINETLDSLERLRLKLRASASIGETVAKSYIAVLSGNKAVVDADRKTIRNIEMLLLRHEESVRKGYPGQFARADNVLLEILDRADIFFDTHVRVTNLWNLSNKAAMEQAFEDEVVKGTAKSVQRQVQGLGEWLADMSSRNLTEATAIFSRRAGERAREIAAMNEEKGISAEASSLQFSGFPSGRDIEVSRGRERLITRLTEASEELSSDYVSQRESKRLAEKIANSVRLSAGLGAGALGSFSIFLVNSSSLGFAVLLGDPTIPLVAGIMGTLGLVTVPRQRMALRAELRARVMSARTRLRNELRGRLEEQLTAHVSDIRGAIQPFADFSEGQSRAINERIAIVNNSLNAVKRLVDEVSSAEMFDVAEDEGKR